MTPEECRKVAAAALPRAVDRAARLTAAGATSAGGIEFLVREVQQAVMDATHAEGNAGLKHDGKLDPR